VSPPPTTPQSTTSLDLAVTPGGCLRGRVRVPGDKSISHRALILGAIAEGTTEVEGFLEAGDTLATAAAFQAMGVPIERPAETRVVVRGAGLRGLRAPERALYLGNSGTAVRLLAGVLAGQSFDTELTGDASLSRRPMSRITEPLAAMGAEVSTSTSGTPPLHIRGGRALAGIDYRMPVASAQVKSCLLLAGLYASGVTCVMEPAPARDHTERMLAAFGYALQRDAGRVCLQGDGVLHGTRVAVPADISSAAFFMVGAAIAAGSELLLENVGINPTRTGVITILRAMGADLALLNVREQSGEPRADIRVRASRLHGVRIAEELVPLAIDEFPALFVAAACAEGETILAGAGELRVKESDRIEAMAEGLRRLGVEATPTADGMRIRGGPLGGATVASHGDHRVAMALSMAGLAASAPVRVTDCANVDTSFPGYAVLARRAGLAIETRAS
jgi:3-phosphoshikimate 1-carboxyvinyltransferase